MEIIKGYILRVSQFIWDILGVIFGFWVIVGALYWVGLTLEFISTEFLSP